MLEKQVQTLAICSNGQQSHNEGAATMLRNCEIKWRGFFTRKCCICIMRMLDFMRVLDQVYTDR